MVKILYILSKCASKYSRTRHMAQNLLALESAKIIKQIENLNKDELFNLPSIPISFYSDSNDNIEIDKDNCSNLCCGCA